MENNQAPQRQQSTQNTKIEKTKNVKINKNKKTKNEVKLPSARKSIKRQRHMAQGKAEWNGMMELLTGVIVVGLILFILFGGINQRKFFETMKNWSDTMGQKVQQIMNPDQVIVDDDGVYYDVDGDGNPG